MSTVGGAMDRISVVGVGPGDAGYVTQKGRSLIESADYVTGFRTVLNVVAPYIKGKPLPLDYKNQEQGFREIAQHHAEGGRCVICVYGDLNFSEKELLALVRKTCGPVDLVPGVSSIQLAAARAGVAMDDSLFISFHKRAALDSAREELLATALVGRRNVLALPRPWDFMPADMARFLLEGGIVPARQAVVLERLTLEGERVRRLTLAELAGVSEPFSDLSVFVLLAPTYNDPTAP